MPSPATGEPDGSRCRFVQFAPAGEDVRCRRRCGDPGVAQQWRARHGVLSRDGGGTTGTVTIEDIPTPAREIRNTPAELEMLEKGDVVGYYESRLARGDAYAALALDVVKNQGVLGKAANLWLFDNVAALSIDRKKALFSGGTYIDFIESVNVGLAGAHASAVDLDSYGVRGLLSAGPISAYHETYSISRGLSATTFGGSALGFRTSYWCGGCDTGP